MPIYEYHCRDCGKTFEEIVSDSGAENPPCPTCKSNHNEKLMSRIGSIGMGKGGSSDFACASGSPCPGAASCGAGGCCPSMQ